MIDFISKLLKTRKGYSIYLLIVSFALSLFFGLLFGTIALFDKSLGYITAVIRFTKISFLFFCAPAVLSSLLLNITNIKDDWCIKISYILYYGTILISGLLPKIVRGSNENIMFLSFIIALLITIIIYICFKGKEET